MFCPIEASPVPSPSISPCSQAMATGDPGRGAKAGAGWGGGGERCRGCARAVPGLCQGCAAGGSVWVATRCPVHAE